MIASGCGFIFEGKLVDKSIGINKAIGLKEDFKISFSGKETETVKLTLGLDSYCNILPLSYYKTMVGFDLINNIISRDKITEDIIKFAKSNRAIYSVTSADNYTLGLICTVSGKLNRVTKEWADDVNVSFFTVKRTSQYVFEGTTKFGFFCDLLSSKDGVNLFKVSDNFINCARSTVLSQLRCCLESKEQYILARL